MTKIEHSPDFELTKGTHTLHLQVTIGVSIVNNAREMGYHETIPYMLHTVMVKQQYLCQLKKNHASHLLLAAFLKWFD